MRKGLFLLASFLGALGIGLFWFSGFIENLKETSLQAGKAECRAEYLQNQIKKSENNLEVKNVQIRKEAVIWARPNPDWGVFIERMRTHGIGTGASKKK